MQLSNNFRLGEFTRSDTAKRLGKEIKKTPPQPVRASQWRLLPSKDTKVYKYFL